MKMATDKATAGLLARVRTSPTAAVVFGLVAGAVLTLVLLDTFGLIRRPAPAPEDMEVNEDAREDGPAPAPQRDPEVAPGAGATRPRAGRRAPVRHDAGGDPGGEQDARDAVPGPVPPGGPVGS